MYVWDEGGGGRAKFQISTVYCVYHSRTRIYILSLYVQNAKLKWKILLILHPPSYKRMYNGDGRGGYCSLKKYIYGVRFVWEKSTSVFFHQWRIFTPAVTALVVKVLLLWLEIADLLCEFNGFAREMKNNNKIMH